MDIPEKYASVAWNLNKNSGLRAAVWREREVTCEIVYTKLENAFQMAFVYLKSKLGHKPAATLFTEFFFSFFFFPFWLIKMMETHEQPPEHAGPVPVLLRGGPRVKWRPLKARPSSGDVQLLIKRVHSSTSSAGQKRKQIAQTELDGVFFF